MHLRIASAPDLVKHLAEVLTDDGEKMFDPSPVLIIRHKRRFFFLIEESGTVGGPFPHLGAMITSEGVRKIELAEGDSGADLPERWQCFGRAWHVDGDRARIVQTGDGPSARG